MNLSRLLFCALLGACARHATASPAQLVEAARSQIGVTVRYDGAYQKLAYPGGDVAQEVGVCTDVVVRAYRKGGLDLQRLVHEDMLRAWASYPRLWQLRRPDRNIDHRRVPNLQTFFKRRDAALPVSARAQDYRAGDLVTWMLPGNLPHIGIVSDRAAGGRPLVIHNIGAGTREEDALFAYRITGHYRFPAGRP
ncbi:DUF1287 domain-containing protein [Massilia glaciei]|uniref:DUF1287 domain-containing protein n=1 Tax=Massilia glaciei TaxID=1524097 RepID=A0A2U2I6Q0_9BURK|nr:DUF1287 domain-containing protein [Massilia glaciei]PWF55402.1 DUF1287 domain-containing protein [Massilia glaciei]